MSQYNKKGYSDSSNQSRNINNRSFQATCILCKNFVSCFQLNDGKTYLCNQCKAELERTFIEKPEYPRPKYKIMSFSAVLKRYILESYVAVIGTCAAIIIMWIGLFLDINFVVTLVAIAFVYFSLAVLSTSIIFIILNIRLYYKFQNALKEYILNKDKILANYKTSLEKYHQILYIYDYWPTYPPDWSRRKEQVIERDNKKCTKCHMERNRLNPLHVHHIFKLSHGGSNQLSNLITLCQNCHLGEPGHEHMRYSNQFFQRKYRRRR